MTLILGIVHVEPGGRVNGRLGYICAGNFGRKSIINLTLGWHALNVFGHFLSQDTR